MPEAEGGAAELLATASGMVEHAATLDLSLRELAQRLETLRYEAADVGAELRAYLADDDDSADGPAALEQVQERLAVLSRLARKHGGTIEDVLAHAQRCRERQLELRDADDALERAQDEHGQAVQRLDGLAKRLTRARAKAAPKLAAAVRGRLAELAMDGARFELELSPRDGGCGPRGADALEMMIAPNAGGPLAPLRESASGGELSRVMLALLSVAHGSARGRARTARCWCSTRSTPGSAATRPARSASTCARWRRDVRSSASRTCRRWRRSPSAISRSSRTARSRRR